MDSVSNERNENFVSNMKTFQNLMEYMCLVICLVVTSVHTLTGEACPWLEMLPKPQHDPIRVAASGGLRRKLATASNRDKWIAPREWWLAAEIIAPFVVEYFLHIEHQVALRSADHLFIDFSYPSIVTFVPPVPQT